MHRSGTAYTVWPVMWTYLVDKKLKQVDEEQALALARKVRRREAVEGLAAAA